MINLFLCYSMMFVASDGSSNITFSQYLAKYNKHYNNTEYSKRESIYYDNLNYIQKSNSNTTKTYKLGINNFTDMTHDEFSQLYLNLKINTRKKHMRKSVYSGKKSKIIHHHHHNNSIPLNMDWRASGVVTDVKNQGQCGSCWAFSAVGAIEGQHALHKSQLVSLSEQNLVDCAFNYSCEGCNGGFPDDAMRYVENNGGIDTEDSYGYIGSDGNCHYNKSTIGASVSEVVNLPNGSMIDLYQALATVGPISVALDAENDFQMYSSGIYQSTQCSSTMLDHAVLAVGYGVSFKGKKYLIIKNSWGADWGMDGYIYFSTEIDNMCGIASYASFPLV